MTPLRLAPLLKISAVAAAFGVLAACSGETTTEAEAGSPEPTNTFDSAAWDNDILSTDIILGAEDAPVTIIEYASITCNACAAFHEQTFKALKEKYIDTGQVRLVFREYPVVPPSLQELSFAGSMLARCLARENGTDAYFTAIGGLMGTMHPLNEFEYIDNPRGWLVDTAAEAGMTETELDACLQDAELFEQLKAQVDHGGETYRITGTPSFIVNGQTRRGLFTLEQFDEVLQPLLSSE